MKKTLLLKFLLAAAVCKAQPMVQPISSGNYWQIDEYENRLPELANKTTFPAVIHYADGSVAISSFSANKLNGENEITWTTSTMQNAENFVVEWSRDLKTFEQATVIRLTSPQGSNQYSFRHRLDNSPLVYYRIGIVSSAKTIAYTPAVQVMDEEYSTKVFPTIVKGSTFYIQTGTPYEKLQVINSANQAVYEKGINGVTGTITIGLPALPKGMYFVRLLTTNKSQHVEKILVE